MSTLNPAVQPNGSTCGWISGTPASLAANATSQSIFDLGPNWDQYLRSTVIINSTAPSSGYINAQIFFGSTPSPAACNIRSRDSLQGATGWNYLSSTAAQTTTAIGQISADVKNLGRYMMVQLTNADSTNAQGAGSFVFVANHTF